MGSIVFAVLSTLLFVGYIVSIARKSVMQKLYKNGWGALGSHVVAALGFVGVGAAWAGGIGAGFALGIIGLIILFTLLNGSFVADVRENTAAFIMQFKVPLVLAWNYLDFAELNARSATRFYEEGRVDGTIMKIDELYTDGRCHEPEKLLKKKKREDVGPKEPVFFKRALTRRSLRRIIIIRTSSFYMTDDQKKDVEEYEEPPFPERDRIVFPYLLDPSSVFMELEGHEFDCATIDKFVRLSVLRDRQTILQRGEALPPEDQQELQSLRLFEQDFLQNPDNPPKDVTDLIGKNFWSFANGFYFKHPASGGGKRIQLTNNAVLKKTVGDQGIASQIDKVDHGDAGLWGSVVYVGPWPFFRLYTYMMKWESPDDGKKRPEEPLKHVNLNDDVYVIRLNEAEDRNQLKLNFTLYAKIRVVNPYNALFRIQRWLENLEAIVQVNYRKMVSTAEFEDIYQSKDEYGESWWKVFQSTIADPKGEHLERRYGVRILVVEIADVTLADKDARDLQEAIYKAERERKKVLIDADAEQRRIERVYDTILSRGDRGMLIRMFETLKEAGKAQGNWVIPFGSIESLMSGFVNKSQKPSSIAALAQLGEASGMTPEQMLELWKAIVDKKKEATS